MKHAAEVLNNVYCSKASSPSGVWYHFSETRRPPSLIRITKVIWHTSPTEYTLLGERRKRLFGEEVIIWQRGWRYIKGARKIARNRRKLHDLHKYAATAPSTSCATSKPTLTNCTSTGLLTSNLRRNNHDNRT